MAIEDRVVRGDAAATETHDWGTITWLDSAALTGGSLTLGRVVIEAGAANPRHRHPNCDEALYVLEGELEHGLGEESVHLAAGDLLHIPAGEPHDARNPGETAMECLVAYDTGEREFELVE